ncbi:MAG TPA: phosphotransferase [Thermoanaerobaculia bacterium]|nr:phosphotransferase [Thermoanaerobaculia bacterium]
MNDSFAARLYYERYLHVPKSRRQRLLRPLRMLATPFVPRTVPDDALARLLWEGAPPAHSSVVLDDTDQDGRRRLLAFLFAQGARRPFAIAKAQSDLSNGSLRSEADGLRRVRGGLPPDLQSTIPEVLQFQANDRGEVLVISALPGRSAYLDMRASLRPSRFLEAHFSAAARWLAAFHDATGATHGDFWPHNLLLDGDRVSVVDWENFTPSSSPFVDLFHFPLTYGQSYRYADPETSFARTFLEPNRLSRAVAAYLHGYASRRGLNERDLAPAFAEFLATRGTMGSGEPHPGTRGLPWERLAKRTLHGPAFALPPLPER